MAAHTRELQRRLGRVRLRWRLAAAAHGLLLVVTEALGLFLVYLLADYIYSFPGKVLLGMMCVGAVVLGVLFLRHVVYQLVRRIPDEQIALLIEERAPQAEGSVITALEYGQQRRDGLYGYILNFLVDDAVHRIDRSHLRVMSNVHRLKQHAAAAGIMLLVFAAAGLLLPDFTTGTERIVAPWETIEAERQEALNKRAGEMGHETMLYGAPMGFEIEPGNKRILRGGGLLVTAHLSREPADETTLWFRAKRGGDWKPIKMEKIEALRTFEAPLTDIYEDLQYFVYSSKHRSSVYEVAVYDPLALRHVQLTYHFPDYLKRDPFTKVGLNGDVEALAGTKVEVKVVCNNRLTTGKLTFDDDSKKTVALTCGESPEDGAKASFVTDETKSSYRVRVKDVNGQELVVPPDPNFFLVKALPDKPPSIELIYPKVDMSVHPLCEVTFEAKVTDDYGIDEVAAKVNYYRGEKPTPLTLKLKPAEGEKTTLPDGSIQYVARHVWQLEAHKPKPQIGDMMFYHVEVKDRKGQSDRSDMYYIKLFPLEVVAAWPTGIAAPDLPHWDYYHVPHPMLFAAAAWNIEQQRGKISTSKFNLRCEQLGERMAPWGSPLQFFGQGWSGPADEGGISQQLMEQGYKLLMRYQPGKAAEAMTRALARLEGTIDDKRLAEFALNPEPLHTGQPSGGFSDDPIQEQVTFRPPSVMCDSLTAFQQMDNPPHHLPPDYRRGVKLKKRTGSLTKQLKVAGEIYASEEMLIEMAKETIGHLRLREAADLNVPNEVAATGAGGGQSERVDKRAIPWAKMDPHDGGQDEGQKPTLGEKPKRETVKGLKYARLRNNKRRGGSNPHRSQTAGGTGGGEQDRDPDEPDDLDTRPLPKQEDLHMRSSRQRTPQQSGGGGGGSRQQQQQRRQQQQQQSGGGGGGGGGQMMPQQMPTGAQMAAAQRARQAGRSGPQQQSRRAMLSRALANKQANIAQQAGNLARAVARRMDPSSPVDKEALQALREAGEQYRKAEEGFRVGDLRKALAAAIEAQRRMRTAMNILKIGQYENIEQAVQAAQRGAATMVENQNRISRATQQLESRIAQLVGKEASGGAMGGQGQPGGGSSASGSRQRRGRQPQGGQAGGRQAGGKPPEWAAGQGPKAWQSGKQPPQDPAKGQKGGGAGGRDAQGRRQPGGQPGAPGGSPRVGKGQPRTGKGQPRTGKGQAGQAAARPGKSQGSRSGDAQGQSQAGGRQGSSRQGQPAGRSGVPGGGQGDRIGNEDLHEAARSDPRLGGQIKSISRQQADMAKEIGAFAEYVKDLKELADKAEKSRIGRSVESIEESLKTKDTGRKMIDTSITINRGELTSARGMQNGIERDLNDLMGEIQATGDLLAGDPTGKLAQLSRTATEVGTQIKRIAGLPTGQRRGQPAGARRPGGPRGPQTPGGQQAGRQAGQQRPGQQQAGGGGGGGGGGSPGQRAPGMRQPGQQSGAAGKQPSGKGQQQPGKGGPQQPGKGPQQPGKGQKQPGGPQDPGKGGPQQPGEGGPRQPGKGRPGEPGKAEPGKGQQQPGQQDQEPGKGGLSEQLAQASSSASGGSSGQPGQSMLTQPGAFGVGTNRDIEETFFKARKLERDLTREQLVDEKTLRTIRRKVATIEDFKAMFRKANKADAGKFADIVLDVGTNLEQALKEALSAKRLHAEQREECPPKYRKVVDAYFEALSKAVSSEKKNPD